MSLTILLAALLPSLSHAMLVRQGASFAEICSATGAKLVVIDAAGNIDTTRDSASLMNSSSMDLQREPDPKGDRVSIVMSGTFLPDKTH